MKKVGPSEEQITDITARIADWPETDRKIAERLVAGDSIKTISAAVKCPPFRVRGVGFLIGWTPQWRKLFKDYSERRVVTLSPETIRKIYQEDHLTLEKIAAIAGGVTRERIRQLLLVGGHDPKEWRKKTTEENRRIKNEELLARRTERQAIRRSASEKHYALHRKLWAAGVPMEIMAAQLNCSSVNSLKTIICRLRHRFGWFPKRIGA